MAVNVIATGDALTRKLWAKEILIEAQKEIFWGRAMGKGPNNIIEVKEDLMKEKGDQITYGLYMKLSGAGISGDSTLEGNEEDPTKFSDAITVDQKRNAVRLAGALTEMRPAYDLRSVAKELLKIWLAETIDSDIFTAFAGSPTKVLRPGSATSKATLVATDLLTLSLGSKGRVLAGKLSPRILPIGVGGGLGYMAVIHPDNEYDLKVNDANWQLAMKDAMAPGTSNPLFTGSVGVYDMIAYHSHVNIGTFADGGSGSDQDGSTCLFLGRQAMVFAWAKKPFWTEKEFDYGNQVGFATGAIWGQNKSVFNSEDYAMIALECVRTNIAEQA